MSDAMVQQEYYCSYDLSVEGAYYSKQLGELMDNGQVGIVNHDQHKQVHIILDFGYTTAMWFVQEVGVNVHVIRYYEEAGKSIEDYAKMFIRLKEDEGYEYGDIIVPCDMDSNATRIITGNSAMETLRDLGFGTEPLKKEKSVIDGIERTQKFLRRCYFDAKNCEQGLVRLESYHEKLNKGMSTDMNPVFTGVPEKDGNDHGADGFRYVSKAFEDNKIGRKTGGITNSQIAKLSRQYSRTG